ncbi:MAG: SH3 domain-containing protein, partial [Chitinispirillales bacterium]|nr:SH3 domain-containing protein [Chitinispirillales bacterium]
MTYLIKKKIIYLQFALLLFCPYVFADTVSNSNKITLYVLKNTVNLRQLPAIDSEIAGKGLFGERLTATRKKGQWYQVTNRRGVQVWVMEDLVG